MSIKRFVIGEVSSSLLMGCVFLFFSYRTLLTGKNFLFADLFGIALFAASLLLIADGTRWIGLLIPFKKKTKTTAKFGIPCSVSIPIGLHESTDQKIIVYFTNVSPHALSGTISVSHDGIEEPSSNIVLTSPRPYRDLLNNERWSHNVEKYFPLKLLLKAPKGSSANLHFHLKWNFEGTYLERLLPAEREAFIEVWTLS